jgi:hypothetical protein
MHRDFPPRRARSGHVLVAALATPVPSRMASLTVPPRTVVQYVRRHPDREALSDLLLAGDRGETALPSSRLSIHGWMSQAGLNGLE